MINSGNASKKDWRLVQYDLPECQRIYAKAKVSEYFITKDLSDITNNIGRSLEGLEYSVKEGTHIDKKLETIESKNKDNFDPVRNLRMVKDLVRYTVMSEPDEIPGIIRDVSEELKKRGYVMTDLKNYYANPHNKTGYKAIHTNFVSPIGQKFEVQFHSPESLKAKLEGHSMYKKVMDPQTPEAERDYYKQKTREVHEKVSNPKGVEEIKEFSFTGMDISINPEFRQDITKLETSRIGEIGKISAVVSGPQGMTSIDEFHMPDGRTVVSVFEGKDLSHPQHAETVSFDKNGSLESVVEKDFAHEESPEQGMPREETMTDNIDMPEQDDLEL